jgi:hypothetical protein
MRDKLSDAEVIMSDAYPLVRELVHKHKLVVMGKRSPKNPESHNFMLSREDGIVVGCAGYDKREGQFFFRSVCKIKERGRTYEDKATFSSIKLPSLMRTIEKQKLIPTNSVEVINKIGLVPRIVNDVVSKNHHNVIKGSGGFSGATIHELLKVAFNYRSMDSMPLDSIDFFKKALDEYDQVDKTREARLNMVREVFDKPIKFLMRDSTDTFVKGYVKVATDFDDQSRLNEAKVTELQAERVLTFMDDADIAPRMAMFKVVVQKDNDATPFVGEEGFYPAAGFAEGYHEDLGIFKLETEGWRYDHFPSKPDWVFFV